MSTQTAPHPHSVHASPGDGAGARDAVTSVWVLVEHRHSFDIDDQPISRTTLVAEAGFFTDQATATAAAETLNAPLRDAHDRFVAQQYREHSAAVKAYERALLERKVIEDAGLIPSSPAPTPPAAESPEPTYEEFVSHLHATSPYKRYEAVALLPGSPA